MLTLTVTAVSAWVTGYLFPFLGLYLLAGAIVELIDRYAGVKLYRWYYNRGTPEGEMMPGNQEMGFFYRRSLRSQHWRAFWVSATGSGFMIWAGHYTAWETLGELVAVPFEGWAFLPGLWLGDKLYSALVSQDKIFEALDHKEEAAKTALAWFGRTVGKVTSIFSSAKRSASVEASSAASPAAGKKPGLSAADILKRHSDGRSI